ncbi:MAG: hypothetical protein ABIP68_09095 [Ferruginibacter sp.]
MNASEKLQQIGKELYGDNFSLQDPNISDPYHKVFNRILLGLKKKKGNGSYFKSKGLFINGGVGVGKTAMMRVMQRYFKDTGRRFRLVTAGELRDMSETMTIAEIKAIYGANLKCDLFIDDIGINVDVRRYGNTVNIISEIIYERYELYVASGFKLHLTSNAPPSLKDNPKNIPTIETIYGARIFDRIKEMCELVVYTGKSLR